MKQKLRTEINVKFKDISSADENSFIDCIIPSHYIVLDSFISYKCDSYTQHTQRLRPKYLNAHHLRAP
jgi:hypothetical protein